MKDHEGYLPKGWMMHEPYNLHNGTPALAIYTYLYRTTRKNAWQGSLQTLADLVEIPLRTVRTNLKSLCYRGLVSIEPLAYSHYSIKAQRLSIPNEETVQSGSRSMATNKEELDICGTLVGRSGTQVGISGTEVDISGTPIKDNYKYNINIKETNSRGGVKEADASTTTATTNDCICRKDYIAKVLSRSIPEYPFGIIYEYAAIVGLPRDIVDSFIIHYEQTGWKMKNGGKIVNWVAALKNWQRREQHFSKENAAKAATAYQARSSWRGAGGEVMTEKNRAIYEQEQERKRREKEQREKESAETLSYEEFQALKKRLTT